jgi:N-glycosylase/DNA lyase
MTAPLAPTDAPRQPAPVPPSTLRPDCSDCEATPWGEAWQLGTAAFWVQQAAECPTGEGRHRLGRNLREEVSVCMLGGYGVPGPVGNAAFIALRNAGLLVPNLDEETAAVGMTEVLAQPLDVGHGRKVRYRFHQQRPRRLAAALTELAAWEHEVDALTDTELRNRLMHLPGVGPKTASWVVRNHRDSEAIAIIDIHIRRAGINAGVFCAHWALPRHYDLFEDAFLTWAAHGAVSAADLDAAIWRMLSALGRQGRAMVLGR